MDILQVTACPKCYSGSVYAEKCPEGIYYGCTNCGTSLGLEPTTYTNLGGYNPTGIQSKIGKNPNGNNTKVNNVPLEDICIEILGDLFSNGKGLSLTFITGLRNTKTPTTKSYLQMLMEGGYVVSSDNGNNASIVTYGITDKGKDVFTEYKTLVNAIVSSGVASDTYKIFNSARNLTEFGSFAKMAADKQSDKYEELGKFIEYMEGLFKKSKKKRNRG